MNLPAETRDRIFAAADALFEQDGRDGFPSVGAVRKAARVNMNDASSAMKDWRRAQTMKTAPLTTLVPQAVQAAGAQAVAALWQQAQELANESLRAAQAGWEAERSGLDDMRAELSKAFETQATELERVQTAASVAAAQYNEKLKQAQAEMGRMQAELDLAHEDAVVARERAAELAGQLAVYQDHAAALLARLEPADTKAPRPNRPNA